MPKSPALMAVPCLALPGEAGSALQKLVRVWARDRGYAPSAQGRDLLLSRTGRDSTQRQILLRNVQIDGAPAVLFGARLVVQPSVTTSVDHVGTIPRAQQEAIAELRSDRDHLLRSAQRAIPDAKPATRQMPTEGPARTNPALAAVVGGIAFAIAFAVAFAAAFALGRSMFR